MACGRTRPSLRWSLVVASLKGVWVVVVGTGREQGGRGGWGCAGCGWVGCGGSGGGVRVALTSDTRRPPTSSPSHRRPQRRPLRRPVPLPSPTSHIPFLTLSFRLSLFIRYLLCILPFRISLSVFCFAPAHLCLYPCVTITISGFHIALTGFGIKRPTQKKKSSSPHFFAHGLVHAVTY